MKSHFLKEIDVVSKTLEMLFVINLFTDTVRKDVVIATMLDSQKPV